MGLEEITRKIVSEADEYAASVIAEAEAEAKAIAEGYESAAEAEYNRIVDDAYEKAGEIMHRSNAQSMKEKRINVLSTKWEYLDNAFSAAVKMLGKLPDADQVRLMADLIARHRRSDAELIFNAADRARLGKAVVDRVNAKSTGFKVALSETTRDFSGGVILKEGGIETNLTYEALTESNRERLEEEVFAILFEATGEQKG